MPAKDLELRRIRQHEYRQTPEYKEQRREYMVAYRQTSVYKEGYSHILTTKNLVFVERNLFTQTLLWISQLTYRLQSKISRMQ